MTLIFKQLFSLLKVLNSETGENQIAMGVCCGLILGFAPVFSLQTILVIIVILLFRIQAGAAFSTAFFFALIAFIFDPFFDMVGGKVLEIESLYPLFQTLYNLPIVPFTKFYNSVVMGAGITSILLTPVVFIASKKLIQKYRLKVMAKFQNTKFWKGIKATSFYKWYIKYNEFYG